MAELTALDRYSPLIFATLFAHPQVAQVLLESKARTGHRDASGRTALDRARELREPHCIRLLELAEEHQ